MTLNLSVGENIRTAMPGFSTLPRGARVFADRESLGVLISVGRPTDDESLLIQRAGFGYALYVWKDVPTVVLQFTTDAGEGVEYRCTLNRWETSGWRSSEKYRDDEIVDRSESPFRRVMVYAISEQGMVSAIRSVSFHSHHVERVFKALESQAKRYESLQSLREVEAELLKVETAEMMERGGYYRMED